MILVTGGTGLVGSYLLLELCQLHEKIFATKRTKSDIFSVKNLFERENLSHFYNRIEWIEADLCDETSFDSIFDLPIQDVYHFAGLVDFDDRKSKELIQTNTKGTEFLINLCLSSQVKSFVYLSSISVYNEKKTETIYSEYSEWNTQNPFSQYALSKKMAEMEVWRGAEEGLDVVILQAGVILGNLNRRRYAEKLFSYYSQKNPFVTSGETAFVDVKDVVRSALELKKNKIFNQSFIAISENLTFKKFALFFDTDKTKKLRLISNLKLKIGYHLSKVLRLFGLKYLSKSNYNSLTEINQYSNEKILKTLNFSFIPIQESVQNHSKTK